MPRIATDENWIGQLSPPVQAALAARMVCSEFAVGAQVTASGAPSLGIHQVIRGYVKVAGLYPDGRHSFVTLYGPGNCFNETAVVGDRPYHHSKIALTEAVVGCVPKDDFWALYQAHPEIPEALCRKFANAIGRQIQSREIRATHRLRKLVAMLFETLAERCAETRTPNSCVIAVPISQSDIGDRFDVTRQSIQREITALKSAGILDKRGGRWIVRDLARLASV